MIWRYRLSLGLEALVWALAMCWLVFLIWDTAALFRASRIIAWRNVFEIALLALLVYWPLIRVRIVHGYWMRDWDDDRADIQPLPLLPSDITQDERDFVEREFLDPPEFVKARAERLTTAPAPPTHPRRRPPLPKH